ncbi:Carboxymuconolactone decarboxylase family protein [Roseovarius albus]|uniref:Carboxymuconolactone decarboxylase family protein n=1 Tax=Roseovarius albus TaxID=1247867 RepID=A0A1X6ZVC4_9RHOB|nr:carboxymuconolactone decarboxylase family protein [Roseovarius albus]SLN62238.1 Carboxymuconolactone decarboxylase family protein [Roseovarius albus]
MSHMIVHTEETAPEASKPIIEATKKAFGFLPNLTATFAESPAMVEAYGVLAGHFEKTDLTPTERQIVLMTTSRENGCTYCMAAHSTVSQMQNVPADVIDALRNDTTIADPKLQALQVFTTRIHETRGNVDQVDLDAFHAAGYTKANILDVILGAGLKTLSNYTNHIAETPLDAPFQANVWSGKTSAAA